MISCRRATKWMLHALDKELPWFRRVLLSSHRFQCRSCRRFGQQIVVIERSFAEFADSNLIQVKEMSQECRTRISDFLRSHGPQ